MAINFEALTVLPWDDTLGYWAAETIDKGGETEYYFPENVVVSDKIYEVENSCDIGCGNDCRRCANNDGFLENIIEIENIHTCECINYRRTILDQIGSAWSNWYYDGYRITQIQFKTNWAEFIIFEDGHRLWEIHCGYSRGCVWTDPEEISYEEGENLEQIKNKYIEFYGKYKEE